MLYEVKKVFNNNAVLVKQDEKEYILVGKGIGFDKKKGEEINDNEAIEHVFIMVDEINKKQYEKLLKDVDNKIFIAVENIISMAEKELGEKLHPDIHFGLIDHINFAIKRIKEGIEIVNPFILETKLMYKVEYDLAQKAVSILNEELELDIPESEIGFITLHIHGGRLQNRKGTTLKYVQAISQVIPYIEDKLAIKIEENSFNSVRLIAHLRGVLDRCSKNETIESMFSDRLKRDFPFEFKISENIALILEKNSGIMIAENEVGYIALHIYKLNQTK